jgi:phenylalanyl-tRNA synthetase beta chain
LREALVPGLAPQVEANWAAQTRDVRLFEVGTVFAKAGAGERPAETLAAAFVVTGARHPGHWTGGPPPDWDRWDAAWLFERLVALAHPAARVQVGEDGWVAVTDGGTTVGRCGPIAADAPPWAGVLFGGEVTCSPAIAGVRPFRPLPLHPPVVRDLALLLADDRRAAEVVNLVHQRGPRHGLESVEVVDEYRGAGLPAGRRSVAFRLVFRAPDRTLTDPEVDQALQRLVQMLERELDVTLRSA